MKKVAVCLVAALFSTSAFGAIVQFTPVAVDVDPLVTTIATFDVTIIPEVTGGFDTADIVFGSNDGLTMVDFAYSADWLAAFSTVPDPLTPVGIYASDLWISGNNSTLNDLASIFAGTLTVDATGIAVDEKWAVMVDVGIDGFSGLGQLGELDGAIGAGDANGVPEPATLALLGIGGLVALRRRR